MFNILKINQTERDKVKESIYSNCRPGVDFYILTALSAIIATLGLIIDNAAIVIGGMLIAPLFYPTISLSMAIVRGNTRLFEKSIYNLLKAIAIVIFLAWLVSFLAPAYGESNEILSRSEPNLLHLFIALFSGIAGAVSITYPKAPTSLAGVLVAAALVPPLGVAGFGIAALNIQVIAGSLLLFVANLLSIVFMGTITFYVFGFAPKGSTGDKAKKIIKTDLIWSAILLLFIAAPLAYALTQTINKENEVLHIRKIVSEKLQSKNLISIDTIFITRTKEQTKVKITVNRLEIPSQEQYYDIKNELQNYFNETIGLELIINPSYRLNY